jgi:hypothetical protein
VQLARCYWRARDGSTCRFHAADDGWFTLHRKLGGHWCDLGALPVSALADAQVIADTWPDLDPFLKTDAYASINSIFRPGEARTFDGGESWAANSVTGLPWARRRTDALRWLNACYCDLDAHDGRRVTELVAGVMAAQDSGVIPPPSILLRSGRGLWLLWLLRDQKHPHQPPAGFARNIGIYSRIQRALIDRLAHLGADAAGTDPVRCIRLPGSINSSAGQSVTYWTHDDREGGPVTYRLVDLATALGVPAETRRRYTRAPRDEASTARTARAQAGCKARWRRELERFEHLWTLREYFREGTRNYAVLLYAYLLRRNGRPNEAVERAAMSLGRQCHPRLPDAEIKSQIRSSAKLKRPLARRTIESWLRVSNGERKSLDPIEQNRERRNARRAALDEAICLHRTWSSRRLASHLRDRGIAASASSLSRRRKVLFHQPREFSWSSAKGEMPTPE